MADNRPPKPRPYAPGETYIDMVTGEFKQVQASGPDVVIPVAGRQQEPIDTTRTGGVYGEYDAAKAELNSVTELLARADAAKAQFGAGGIGQAPATSVIFNEKTYNLDGLNKEIARLKKIEAQSKKRFAEAEKVIKPLQKKVDDIKDEIDGAGDDVKRKQAAEAKLPAAQAELEKAKSVPAGTKITSAAIKSTKPSATAPTSVKPGQTTGTTTAAEAPAQPTSKLPAAQNPSARNKIGAGKTAGKTVTGGVAGTVGGKTGGTTGAGGATTAGQDQTKTTTGDVLAGLDIESLKTQYPGYAWIWDLNPKFNDTKKLWADFLNGDITVDRFNNLIGQSSWYTDQRTIGETRRIKNRYGDILDPGTMAKLVNESIQFSYKDDELDNAFFTSALARNVITGEYVDGRAAKTALASNVANSYRNYAKSMFLSTDDQEIEDVLTGKTTAEDFSRTKRQIAQATYKNWADLLNDPAMTMEKIVKPWKDMAASVLELDPTQIDMTKPQFSVAYAGSPDGKMGAMSLGEWYVKLRSDSTYGWDKTTQAKQEAQELGYNIAKAFGKV